MIWPFNKEKEVVEHSKYIAEAELDAFFTKYPVGDWNVNPYDSEIMSHQGISVYWVKCEGKTWRMHLRGSINPFSRWTELLTERRNLLMKTYRAKENIPLTEV